MGVSVRLVGRKELQANDVAPNGLGTLLNASVHVFFPVRDAEADYGAVSDGLRAPDTDPARADVTRSGVAAFLLGTTGARFDRDGHLPLDSRPTSLSGVRIGFAIADGVVNPRLDDRRRA